MVVKESVNTSTEALLSLHRRLDLHGRQLKHQHRLSNLAPVQIGHVGGCAARLAGFVIHYYVSSLAANYSAIWSRRSTTT
jgi:hypothetical protein